MRLVLASASPRRAELLRAAGIRFDVIPATIDERPLTGETPAAYVERVAREKALDVGRRNPGRVILAADTTVVIDEVLLGKPADDAEAHAMLVRLSGRAHDVLTGVAVLCAEERILTAVETTRVRFVEMTAAEIDWYVASGEPRGKAGSYAIQGLGSRFVDSIDGSYSNVVGLPVAAVWRMLREAKLEPGRGGGGDRRDRLTRRDRRARRDPS